MARQQDFYNSNTNRRLFPRRNVRRTTKSSVRTTLSAVAAAAALGGLSIKALNSRSKPDSEPQTTSITQSSSTTNVPFAEITPTPTKEISAETRINTFNQITGLLRYVNPRSAEPITLHRQAALLQLLTTRPDGTNTAILLSKDNLKRFVEMTRVVPIQQLDLAIDNNPDNPPFYSFNKLAQTLQNTPDNSYEVAQQIFLQTARYNTHALLLKSLAYFEKDIHYIYLDAATIVVNGKRVPNPYPTVGKGLNLYAHPYILAHIRVKNSERLQTILHPDDPEARSKKPYVRLTLDDLKTWKEYALQNGFFNHKAADFFKEFGMAIHPDDLPYLETCFQKLVANSVKNAESELEKRAFPSTPTNESVMFGSFQNPVPESMTCVPADLDYSTKHSLRDKRGWPTFCKLYESRNFAKASLEVYAAQQSWGRNLWRFNSMLPTSYRVGAGLALGGLALAMFRRRLKKRSANFS